MNGSISIATHVFNQSEDLAVFLDALETQGYTEELIVVVMGGEDPFDLLEVQRPFSVKALYLEKSPSKKTCDMAKQIAFSTAQNRQVFFMDVTLTPSKELLEKCLLRAKRAQAGRPRLRRL